MKDVPTVHRQNGFRFMIYPADHPPKHVHVYKSGDYAIINLETGEVPEFSFKTNVLHQAHQLTMENLDHLKSEWDRIKPRMQ